jgi:hypothetical protein
VCGSWSAGAALDSDIVGDIEHLLVVVETKWQLRIVA